MTVAGDAYPWAAAIADRARTSGLELTTEAVAALSAHVRAVLVANERLHLTTITDPAEFLERHLGESLDGAALLDASAHGVLVDLGSGNGYPGLPIAIARPRLTPVLVEASRRKAAFLREALATVSRPDGTVLERHVVRAADLDDLPEIDVLTTRAMGDWERVVPRLASKLSAGGAVLLFTTTASERVLARVAWRRLEIVARHPLPGQDRALVLKLLKIL